MIKFNISNIFLIIFKTRFRNGNTCRNEAQRRHRNSQRKKDFFVIELNSFVKLLGWILRVPLWNKASCLFWVKSSSYWLHIGVGVKSETFAQRTRLIFLRTLWRTGEAHSVPLGAEPVTQPVAVFFIVLL